MEKLSKILVIVGGVLYLIFGVFHLTFFRVFNHKNPDFNQIVPFLSKIMIMLNIGMVVFFVSMGAIMLWFRRNILETRLGKALLLMSALFFIIRGAAEFAFPTFKIAFVITMFVVALVYLIPVLKKGKKSS
jgi:hypothetical protein